ncbi:hypothetical protein [Bradyrhizobium lablabi]|uniref:hypothetical protein n=1 Tax=Bradyrhizobium lablabi TaxID=722472 RepID=UPI00090C3D9C|nr:hypothetical protein [Bradyrhizobium lablabi]SHM83413.1 hypothetical protein SAMN05444321_7809 [Bradyrhizobium lablabi]
MHGSLDKQPREGQSAYRNWDMKLIALPILGVVALIALAVSHPGASKWISDAAQAEFVGTDFVPDLAPPTQLAQPGNQIRTVKAH